MDFLKLEEKCKNFIAGCNSVSEFSGFVVLDKPKSWTSFDLVRKVRGMFRALLKVEFCGRESFLRMPEDFRELELKRIKKLKVGHSGTLDPLATGVMVLAFGKATKKLGDLLGWDKEYEVVARFGAVSDSYDADGEITFLGDFEDLDSNLNSQSVTGDRLNNLKFLKKTDEDGKYSLDFEEFLKTVNDLISENFLGEINQIPPKYSALKIDGKRACDLMREGKEVDISKKSKKIKVYRFELVEDINKNLMDLKKDNDFNNHKFSKENLELKFRINCGSGTYIRSLIHDLGQKLGIGAYVKELRRTKVYKKLLKNDENLNKIFELDSVLNMRFVVGNIF